MTWCAGWMRATKCWYSDAAPRAVHLPRLSPTPPPAYPRTRSEKPSHWRIVPRLMRDRSRRKRLDRFSRRLGCAGKGRVPRSDAVRERVYSINPAARAMQRSRRRRGGCHRAYAAGEPSSGGACESAQGCSVTNAGSGSDDVRSLRRAAIDLLYPGGRESSARAA